MQSRHQARRMGLQMLFEADLGRHSREQVEATFFHDLPSSPEAAEFARLLFRGTLADLETIDDWIRRHAEHWRLERMATVDRNILRLAVFELMRTPETPAPVVIDEALEIAREFSTEEAVEFINGVLDSIRKALPAASPNS